MPDLDVGFEKEGDWADRLLFQGKSRRRTNYF